ncbi:MAG: hypothetical protein JWL77_1514 [Chthonomonadaceae bacterium]|nr:hypothetical protein [Chthonomonadaceae bacterium]
MPYTPTQICSRCKDLVLIDRKSCPINSIETFGRGATELPKEQPLSFLMKAGILTAIAVVFAFWMWGGLVSLKAYDLQAIPLEKAKLVQIGMTHQQVIDVVGRDAVPIPVWTGFETAPDNMIRQLSDDAKSTLEERRVYACSPDRDNPCGAHYTVKDGSGLRIVYRRGIVIYAAVGYGYGRRLGR